MDEKILDSLLIEKDRIEGAISDGLVEKDIREIQREALELLNKIVNQLKIEESTNDLSWEKNNLFYSISLLNHNIRFYPTLLGLRASLTWMDKTLSKKGDLSSSEKKEMEQVNIDLLANHINTLIHIVDGE